MAARVRAAVKTGDVGKVQAAVAAAGTPASELSDAVGKTPVHWAAQAGYVSVLAWLRDEAGLAMDVSAKASGMGAAAVHATAGAVRGTDWRTVAWSWGLCVGTRMATRLFIRPHLEGR